MGRWVGIDYGRRRIGIALSDSREIIASPATTLDAVGDPARDVQGVLTWAAEAVGAELAGFVVGFPLNMDGSVGPQARLAERFADELRRGCASSGGLPPAVELWDERLTSFQADQVMRAAGLSRRRQKRRRDALAAQVILQSFLDSRQQAG